jgi:hypothetical protein
VFLGSEAIAWGSIRHAVARVIHGHTAEVALECSDDLAIEEGPGRVSMQEQECLALALIDVVDADAVEVQEPMFNWEQFSGYREWKCHDCSLLP